MISATTTQQSDSLFKAYLSLTPYEQAVLQVLAVVYLPIGATKLNLMLTQIGRRNCFPDSVRIKGLTPADKAQLIAQGFIAQHKSGIYLNDLLLHRLTQRCVEEKRYLPIVNVIEKVMPIRSVYGWENESSIISCLLRDEYYLHAGAEFEQIVEFHKNPQVLDYKKVRPLIEIYFMPFDLQQFLTLPGQLQYQCFANFLLKNEAQGQLNDHLLSLLEKVQQANTNSALLRCLLAEYYLKTLQFDKFKKTYNVDDASCYSLQVGAAFAFLQRDFEVSEKLFERAIKAKNKFGRRKHQYLSGFLGLCYSLCLIARSAKNARYYEQALQHVEAELKNKETDATICFYLKILELSIRALSRDEPYPESLQLSTALIDHPYALNLSYAIFYLGKAWCGGSLSEVQCSRLADSQAYFAETNHVVFSTLCAQLSAFLGKESSAEENNTSPHNTAIVDFPSLVSRKAQWDIALDRLLALSPAPAEAVANKPKKVDKPARLIWVLSLEDRHPEFSAREQKKTSKGWSKGRAVALKRLATQTDSFEYLSAEDQVMCKAIELYQSWEYYRTSEYRLEGAEALRAATHLDNVFLENDYEHPIDIIGKEPELLINQQGDQLLLTIADQPSRTHSSGAFTLQEITPSSYSATFFNADHLKVADIIGEGGLMIPAEAKAKVLESVSAIAPLLNIRSDMDELETGLETVACDKHLVINIQRYGEGLEFTCVVMPFGEQGPAFKPIVGNVKLTTEIAGKRVATQRDLLHEQVLLDKLDKHCPAFLAMPGNILILEETHTALEALEQLQSVLSSSPSPFLLHVRWPKGQKIQLSKPLDSQHLTLAVGKSSEWFDITGELNVDDEQVLELRKLLDLVSAASSRFVALDSGQVLALSSDLRERLELISRATDEGKFHPLAGLQVAEATTGMRMKTLHAWEAQAKKMHEANTLAPEIPNTLRAELRDYQQEGFDWMMRLAHWKAGACLADDMGLGKTLQALAVLVARAADGPSLVIAPTSVCFNWQQEALKFAPTLNMHLFADYTTAAQRKKLLADIGCFDCVVISYGLLQRASDLLSGIEFHTIVADEAQALKNPLAKRTQAAYALKGDFKIITTGTPIENNLTELWSLFRFITPGLLGNIKRFGERYAFPIENSQEDRLAARKASQSLKALVQPFMLRRMKSQVLQELPPRTEINIQVELSAKEQNFYEALRRNAVDNIAGLEKSANEGEQRIKMLAELVKLRQACCNPKLVMADSSLPSAKLEALDELLDELQQNNHKALIFSQFVGHLQLIKAHLDLRKISYQYLDGSTPQKARKTRVEAFQKGEGDVFLISLKAGGSGLNLTAADYVIHMDPWWNPAVEDQASDRAHRMGQKRPVTIYRLIAKNTIEERIVTLHQHKRDLADSLLTGNEQVLKLSVKDMLDMLKETF